MVLTVYYKFSKKGANTCRDSWSNCRNTDKLMIHRVYQNNTIFSRIVGNSIKCKKNINPPPHLR